MLARVYQTRVAFQFLLKAGDLRLKRIQLPLLTVEDLTQLLERVLLFGEANFQVHDAGFGHGMHGYPERASA